MFHFVKNKSIRVLIVVVMLALPPGYAVLAIKNKIQSNPGENRSEDSAIGDLEKFEQEVKDDSTFMNHLRLGIEYLDRDFTELAATELKKAVNMNPKSAYANYKLCEAYNKLQRWDDAVPVCKRALSIKPDYTLAQYQLKLAINREPEQ